MTKLIPAVAILLMAAPAFAQQGGTMSPPAPNAAASAPQPANSVPPGASNLNTSGTNNPNVAGSIATTDTATGLPATPTSPNPATQPGDAFNRTVPQPAR